MIENSTISDNKGGGLYIDTRGNWSIENSNIVNNENSISNSNAFGAGIYSYSGSTTWTINNSKILGNKDTNGQGVGGLYAAGAGKISNSTVSNNTGETGGGIFNNGKLEINNCFITNNTASSSVGGGISCGGNTTIANTLIANNKAAGNGAGVYVSRSSNEDYVTFVNCTIANNNITDGKFVGAGIYFSTSERRVLELQNCIIAENYITANTNINDIVNSENSFVKGYNCLSSYEDWMDGGENCIAYTSSPFVDSISGNYQLKINSPAIDKGNNEFAETIGMDDNSLDLGGGDRFNGVIDIGCYEYQGEPEDLISITLSTTTPEIGTFITTTLDPQVNQKYIGYQWFRGTSKDNITTVIAGATSSSYTVTANDKGNYLKVVATGKGKYNGTVYASTTDIVHGPLNVITILEENPTVGTLITTELDPAGAFATYQWYRGTDASNVSTLILGATSSSYTAQAADYNYYLKVVAKGAGGFTGTVSATTLVQVKRQVAISTDRPEVGAVITSNILPVDEGATYQWYRGKDPSNITTAITAATTSSYTVTMADLGYYLKLVVKTTNNETLSDSTAYKVSQKIETITLSTQTPKVNTNLTTSLLPSGTTAVYQWYRGTDPNNVSTRISGATSDSYTVTAADFGYYLKVVATGTGNFTGTVSAVTSAKVELPTVDVSLVLNSALSTSEESQTLPQSTQYIQNGKNFYAEIWVKNLDATDPGILGGYVNLAFNKENLNVISIQNSSIYGNLTKGEFDNENGLVNNIGGATALTAVNNYGQNGWVMLGAVEFQATQEGDMDLALTYGQWQFATATSGNLDWSEIRLNSLEFSVEGQSDPGKPTVLPKCCYDLNDNGIVESNDFTIFQDFFGLTVGSPEYIEAQTTTGITVDCDFDGSGKVDLRDFSFFAAAFGKNADDPTIAYPVASPSQAADYNEAVELALASPMIQAMAAQLSVPVASNHEIEVQSVLVTENTKLDTTAELPQSESVLVLNDKVYLELWAKVTDPNAQGIQCAYFDVQYDAEKVDADALTVSGVYSGALNRGEIKTDSQKNEIGLVQNFGGGTLNSQARYGVQDWVKIGSIAFDTISEGYNQWNVSGGKLGISQTKNYDLTWNDVEITSASAYISVRPDASLSKTELNLQYGGSIYIDSQLPADSGLKTFWDLSGSGNGEFVETQSAFWLDSAKAGFKSGNHLLRFKTVNEYGLESNIVSVNLMIVDKLPVIKAEKTSFLNDQLVRLNLEVSSSGNENFNTWLINWGDDDLPTEITSAAYTFSALHYYEAGQQDTTYNISLSLIGDKGTTLNYSLVKHTVKANVKESLPGSEEYAVTLSQSAPALALESEKIIRTGNPLPGLNTPKEEQRDEISENPISAIPMDYTRDLASRPISEESFLSVLENDDFDQTLDLIVKENASKFEPTGSDSDPFQDDLLAIC